MEATSQVNVTLGPENEYSDFIECCAPVGAYMVIAKSHIPEGCFAIFHISSSNDGMKNVKKTVSSAGSNGEQLNIVWPEDNHPVLCYLNETAAPTEDRHYNLKVI